MQLSSTFPAVDQEYGAAIRIKNKSKKKEAFPLATTSGISPITSAFAPRAEVFNNRKHKVSGNIVSPLNAKRNRV